MTEQIPRGPGQTDRFEVSRAGHQLMSVHQKTLGDHRCIDPQADPERQIDALGELVHDPVGDEHVDPDVGIGRLEGTQERGEQRVGDTGRRGYAEGLLSAWS